MADVPNFNFVPNFPIAGVADLYANKAVKEAAMRAQQQAQLVQGMQGLSGNLASTANDVVARRNAIAQAMAQANIFSQTPEGKQIMGTTNVTTSPTGSPIQMNQTAQGTDAQGNLLPAPVSNQSPVGMKDLVTAFKGEQPGNFIGNIQTQAANKRAYDLEASKEANARTLSAERTKQILAVLQGNMGLGYTKVGEQSDEALRRELETLKNNNATLSKQLPGALGSVMNAATFGLTKGEGQKSAQDQLQANNSRIAQLESQLSGKTTSKATHMSTSDLLAVLNQ